MEKFIKQLESITKTMPTKLRYVGTVKEIDEAENYIVYKNNDIKHISINKKKI